MGKKLRRAVGAILIALAVALQMVPAPLALAVSSVGDFEREGNTVYSYNGTASAVSIPAGTTEIAPEAFSNQNQLTRVTFPASLETIGNGAFRSCNSLTDVSLPSGLKTLESGAFAKCENLKSFTFNDSLENLGAGVFSGDDKLSALNLGKNPNFIYQDGALYDKSKTKLYCVLPGRKGASFVVPDSVDEIERYAFWGCRNLTEVTLSPKLTEIPEFAFSNCENLSSINIPLSVRRIAAKAFEDCVSLGNVKIPASVTAIHDTAFDGCRNLNIISDEGTTAYEFFQNFDRSQSALMEYEDESVSENAIGALYPASAASSKTENEEDKKDSSATSDGLKTALSQEFDPAHPADVSKADVWTDYNPTDPIMGQTRIVGDQAVILPGDFSGEQKSSSGVSGNDVSGGEVDMTNPAKLPLESYPKLDDTLSPDSKGEFIRKAYYADEELGNIALSDGTKSIGDLAFARSSVSSMILPDGVEKIGYGAFYHCDNLASVRIPDSVTYIAPEAFDHTPFLDNWLAGRGDDFLIVGDGLLLAYRGSSATVKIPSEVKKIVGGAFEGHSEITGVQIPDQVTEIGEAAFDGCTSLSEFSGGADLVKIADRAFEDSPIAKLHIPSKVESIGLGAFAGATADAVVFESGSVPALGYEQTSTRLTNTDFRKTAFGNVPVAALSAGVNGLNQTILDPDYLGFRGLAVNLPQGLGDGKNAVLLSCSIIPDGNGVVRVPESVTIDGKSYPLIGASPSAFAMYDPDKSTPIARAVILPTALGSIGDYVPSLTPDLSGESVESESAAAAEIADSEKSDKKSKKKKGKGAEEETVSCVQTVVAGSTYPSAELITADCVDDDAPYKLYVTSDSAAEQALRDAVSEKYGTPVSGQLTTLSLQMADSETNVPITNFGKEQVRIRIPISETMKDQQICAVSLGEDGRLQMHYGSKIERDGQNYFTFATTHFSPYGIYAGIGETAEAIAKATADLHNKDLSPDTGDHSPIMLVLGIFLGALGLLLLIAVPKKSR